MLKKIAASSLLVTGMCLLAGNVMAAEIVVDGKNINDTDLEALLYDIGSNITLNQDYLKEGDDDYWKLIGNGGTFQFELQDNVSGYTFGIYSYGNINNKVAIFTDKTSNTKSLTINSDGKVFIGNNTDPNDPDGVGFTGYFGYYLDVGSGIFYSDSTKKDPSYDHMIAWKGDKNLSSSINANLPWYLLGFETSNYTGAPVNFADYVVLASTVSPAPEPATVLLLGTGVAGLTGMVRRRKAKNRYNFNK